MDLGRTKNLTFLVCASLKLKCKQIELAPGRVETTGNRDESVLLRV